MAAELGAERQGPLHSNNRPQVAPGARHSNNRPQAAPAAHCIQQKKCGFAGTAAAPLKLMISICPGQLARNPFPTISLELEISMKAWGSTWRI